MDTHQDITFLDALGAVPDPRQARGNRHAWRLMLTLISVALAAGGRTLHAIAHWVTLHTAVVHAALCPTAARLPSESTMVRARRHIDVQALETQVAQFADQVRPAIQQSTMICPNGERLEAQAMDGKAVRGAERQGQPTHLVSLVRQGSGTTLVQRAVAHQRNEISAAPLLLAGRDLTDTVTTMDAVLPRRPRAQQIRAHHGHDLMIVKRNQPLLSEALERWFAIPTLPADAVHAEHVQTITKGHGRIEARTRECSTGMEDYLPWPGVVQGIRRTCERHIVKTGKTSVEVTDGLTDLMPTQAGAPQLEAWWRRVPSGCWTIENRAHDVRDVTLGEDQGRAQTGSTAHALAAWRNGVLILLRRAGWQNIADALRAYAASVHDALKLIGAFPARL